MNPLHLLWIVPLSMTAGMVIMALAAVNNRNKDIGPGDPGADGKEPLWNSGAESH